MRHWVKVGIGALVTVVLVLALGYRLGIPKAMSEEGLTVSRSELRSQLTHLNYERYSAVDRDRTRTYLTRQLEQYGYQVEPQAFETGINLIITRPGLAPTSGTILVGAHYDTVPGSPGADDNASAIATALEIARLFAHIPTPKNLKIVFFDQEEVQTDGYGLIGSSAFVRNEHNLINLKGVVILEMLGYACHTAGCQYYPDGIALENLPNQGDFLGVIGDVDHPSLLEAFSNSETDISDDTLPVITLPVSLASLPFLPDLFRSDHTPFWIKGIGAVMVTDTADFRNPNYHRATDTLDSLDDVFLIQAAQKVVMSVNRLLQE